MLSRRRSQLFSRKGSMERSSDSKFGASGEEVSRGSDSRAARLTGSFKSFFAGGVGSWWRNEVRM